jgi:hypothetical protein
MRGEASTSDGGEGPEIPDEYRPECPSGPPTLPLILIIISPWIRPGRGGEQGEHGRQCEAREYRCG